MSNIKKDNMNRGFTLLVALLVSSAVLLGSYAISNILFYQLKQVSNNRESQKAFVTADNGIECALFYDELGAFDPVPEPDASGNTAEYADSISCANNNSTNSGNGDPIISNADTVILNSDDGYNIFEVIYGDNDTSPCARITVTKDSDGTVIESRGYNKCDPESLRRVERAIRVNY